jgi:hypothetical protein
MLLNTPAMNLLFASNHIVHKDVKMAGGRARLFFV